MLIAVVKVPNVRCIKIYGLLYEPQPKDLCIKIYVSLWVSGNGRYVMNTVWGYAHLILHSTEQRSNSTRTFPDADKEAF